MDITKVAILGLTGAVLAVVIKENKPVMALMVSIITSLVIFIFIIPKFSEIISLFNIAEKSISINSQYITILVKSVAIAYISMFSSQICRDFGQNAIGDKVELGAKIMIMVLAVPVIENLVNMVIGIG